MGSGWHGYESQRRDPPTVWHRQDPPQGQSKKKYCHKYQEFMWVDGSNESSHVVLIESILVA